METAGSSRLALILTREVPGVRSNLTEATAADAPVEKRRGVIYTIAPFADCLSRRSDRMGTDAMAIFRKQTMAERTGRNVTRLSRTYLVEQDRDDAASHFDAGEACVAVDRHRLEDNEPYIYRTRDAGKRPGSASRMGCPWWRALTQTVMEDPGRKGLLFAGTELGVYVSFNDGGNATIGIAATEFAANPFQCAIWQLMGMTLIVATHGRGFWVLDDITVLRGDFRILCEGVRSVSVPSLLVAIRMHAGTDYASPSCATPSAGGKSAGWRND